MTRASRLEPDLAAPEKLPHTVGVRVLDASLAQEPMGLRDGSYLATLHGLFELLESFGPNQLLAAAFVYPAFQNRSSSKPPCL